MIMRVRVRRAILLPFVLHAMMLRRSSRTRKRSQRGVAAAWLQPSSSLSSLQRELRRQPQQILSQSQASQRFARLTQSASSSTTSSSSSPSSHRSSSVTRRTTLPLHSQHMSDRRTAAPSLSGMSRVRNGNRYRLQVVQHPERARMCGFGDKDRRPLSPSLIVKLIVIDDTTGEPVSPWNVNTSLFFLAADLCHPDDLILAPRNLLVHQHAASVPASMFQSQQQQQQQTASSSQTSTTSIRQGYTPTPSTVMDRSPLPPPPTQTSHSQQSYAESARRHHFSAATDGGDSSAQSDTQSSFPQPSPSAAVTTVTIEHYTRNLVGAAVTSANVLRDENDEYCIFFVLQDLSVRTEGVYRIRLVFTDLAQQDGDTNVNVSEALAEAYTEPFTVFSPRRFPGMLEPTELSKKLAAQGIKIAVRSDKKKRRRQSVDEGSAARSNITSASASGGGQGSRPSAEDDAELDELDDEEE